MRVNPLTVVLLGLIIAIGTFIVPPLWVPDGDQSGNYYGFPLPWAHAESYSWIPIIGPLLEGMTYDFNPLFLAIDAAFWIFIVFIIAMIVGRKSEET